MVSFLDCLKHLIDYVKSLDPHVEFPHQCVISAQHLHAETLTSIFNRIVKDKIGEASVKLQFSQEEAWTRSLRHVLLALKILLKWTTNGSNG
jgi:beclin 1